VISQFRTLSDLLSRMGLTSRAGITYAGSRDLFEALGYKKSLKPSDYRERYKRNGVAARIVEAAPKGTWRRGVELVEGKDPDSQTEFERAFHNLETRLHVWHTLLRVDILAGLGRYAILLIGAKDGAKFDQPLGKLRGPEDILYLAPFAEDEAQIEKFEEDPLNARFGQPVLYTVTRRTSSASQSFQRKIHWSRIVHIAEGSLEDLIYGQPRLERVWNLLDDLEKVTGGGSEAFWQRANPGLHFDIDKELEATPTEIAKMKDELDEYVHGYRRFLLSRGSKLETFDAEVAQFDRSVDSIFTQLSTSTGIPKRVLTGSELGELASTQDRSNWDTQIEDRRDEYAKPVVVRPLVDRLIEHGALPAPKEYDVLWPDIRNLNIVERSQVAIRWSQLNERSGGIVVTAQEIRDKVLGLEPLTPEQEEEAKEDRIEATPSKEVPSSEPPAPAEEEPAA
jgi:hypothetical protein